MPSPDIHLSADDATKKITENKQQYFPGAEDKENEGDKGRSIQINSTHFSCNALFFGIFKFSAPITVLPQERIIQI